MDKKRQAEGVAAARSEIAKRIARFCTALSPEDFNALLDRMARVQWKYDTLPSIGDAEALERSLRNSKLPPLS